LLPTRSRAANGPPAITKPILVDRWVPQPNFSHAKHQVDLATQKPLECNICHQATQSRETSDVLMRAKANWDHFSHLLRAECRANSRSIDKLS
jgi:hypothetical protein